VRALNGQFPFVQLAKAVEQTVHFQNLNGYTRVRRLAIASGCTHAIFNYGTNDLAVRTAAQIEANILEITAALNAKAIKVFWCTLIPKTGSSNSWANVAGQTKGGNESVRLAVNAWLRDTSASGYVAQAGGGKLAGVFDVCAPIEVNAANALTQDGGYWKAPGAASESGTSSGSNTATMLNDTSKSWTANQFAGQYVYITGGTGAGQGAGYIVSNTATQLTVKSSWTATPDATSTYVIVNGYTTDGTHPTVNGHIAMAGAIDTTKFRA
jgi:lysophospholipase L1-like esterase